MGREKNQEREKGERKYIKRSKVMIEKGERDEIWAIWEEEMKEGERRGDEMDLVGLTSQTCERDPTPITCSLGLD